MQSSRRAITTGQMYEIEENGESKLGMPRFLMMENAGHGAADFLVSHFGDKLARKRVVAVCGTGNNGGDGFVVSRHLAGYCRNITVILLGSTDHIRSKEARANWTILEKMNKSISLTVAGSVLSDVQRKAISGADIVIDAIFGTGIVDGRPIGEPFASAIDAINTSKGYVLAIDVPSGIDPNSGKPNYKCVRAAATVTFHRLKVGMKKAKRYTGTIHVEWIGVPPEAEAGVLT